MVTAQAVALVIGRYLVRDLLMGGGTAATTVLRHHEPVASLMS